MNFVGLHLAPQLAAMDFEEMGRLLLIAVSLLEGFDNGFPLHGFQGAGGGVLPDGLGLETAGIQGR